MPYGKADNTRAFGAPGRYIQGPGEFNNLPEYAGLCGNVAFALIDPFFYNDMHENLEKIFEENGLKLYCDEFKGECCEKEFDRIEGIAKELGVEVYIGIGGGKTADTTKAVAARCNAATIIYPTSLATDAPTSGSSMVYREDHSSFQIRHRRNPDYVIVDTEIAVKAPVRMFVAGMGDAMSTWLEARACWESNNINNIGHGFQSTLVARNMAKLSFDILMAEGREAYQAAKLGLRTQQFEDIAEVNTLMSGVGYENTGCTISHGMQSAFSAHPDCRKALHGELVALGCQVQLIAENRPLEEFYQVRQFCKDVGLPTHLDDIGITENKAENAMWCAKFALENRDIVRIEPFTVTVDRLYAALMFVDSLD